MLSSAPANRNALREASALEALVALLGPVGQPLRGDHRPNDLLVEVILAIRNMVTSTRNQDMVRELGGVTRLVEVRGELRWEAWMTPLAGFVLVFSCL